MKLSFILVVFILICNFNVFPQFNIGIQTGINLSKMDMQDNYHEQSLARGFNFGLNALYKINRFLDAETGLIYYQKGHLNILNLERTSGLGTYTGKAIEKGFDRYKVTYIEFPLILDFNLRKFFISAGGYVSYTYKAINLWESKVYDNENKVIFEFQNQASILISSYNPKDEYFSKMDYGLRGGIGYRFKKLSLSVMYDYGLKRVFYNFQTSVNNDQRNTYKNQSFSFNVGYYIFQSK